MPAKIRMEILLCAHQRHLAAASTAPSWRRPVKLPVQLTRTDGAAPAAPKSLGETSTKGVTRPSDLEAGVYRLELPGYDFEASAELDLTNVPDGSTLEVRLAPRVNHGLVVFEFTDYPARTPLSGVTVTVTDSGGNSSTTTASTSDGLLYAIAPLGLVTFEFNPVTRPGGGRIIAAAPTASRTVEPFEEIEPVPVPYWSAIELSVQPTVNAPSGTAALVGASVTVEYQGSSTISPSSSTKALGAGAATVPFEFAGPGMYVVTVTPPPDYLGWPIAGGPLTSPWLLSSGTSQAVPVSFDVVATEQAQFVVQSPQNQPLTTNLFLQVLGPNGTDLNISGVGATFTAPVPANESLQVQLDPAAAAPAILVPGVGAVPLEMLAQPQQVLAPPAVNTIVLDYQHSITTTIVDENGREVVGAMIDVSDSAQNLLRTMVTDAQGNFTLGLPAEGTYYLAQHPQGGQVGLQEIVEVHSNPHRTMQVRRQDPSSPTGPGGGAVTDLSAYPLLTEEISTTGVPSPVSGGGFGGGGGGAGYGQAVNQVIRDVLGWRPSGDQAGFQAALSGAFALREVEGHTEWTWQQRGYAVQADMGALTGAQASIYARAKAALEQIQPLLAGLTSLNPAKYEPQDLETIRSVVGTELQELVTELSLEGGPRIQRVDELFRLLLGQGSDSRSMNPDLVQGQLGTLRQRFALTVDEIQTVDEERVVTNFRIIVEQVLALYSSWNFDKKLLSAMSRRASFGTVLIWLSRGLEAVCESVGDLMFALDSVFVDAAQRQVIELRFAALASLDVPQVPFPRGTAPTTVAVSLHDYAPMFLSDLLDWVLRTSRDEGPRIIQDAGKDGVLAFKPVLDTLRLLVRATRHIARQGSGLSPMPDGMRTPRVDRALQVLTNQLDEAANLASLVQVEEPPTIAFASLAPTSPPVSPGSHLPHITVTLTGSNFRSKARVILAAEDDEGTANLEAFATGVTPSTATATFTNTARVPANAGATWMVSIINDDETQSNWVEVLRVPRRPAN